MYIKTLVATCALLSMLLVSAFRSPSAQADEFASPITLSTATQPLSNASFECTVGYSAKPNGLGGEHFVPNEWTLVAIAGTPVINSARIFFADSCGGSAHVERLDGIDSIVVRSQDIETNPAPGKPFDIAFYQQATVTTGTAYSLSGWMLSLCGGSAVPSDCPADVYITKMLGIDPTGGVDPQAASVVWTENRNNFVDSNNQRIGWQNLRVGVVAQSDTITIFARVNSPFQHHGNHAFIDALSLVQSPTAELIVPASDPISGTVVIPELIAVKGGNVDVRWTGDLGVDIPAIKGGNYGLFFDVEYRKSETEKWQTLVEGQASDGCRVLSVPEVDTIYEVRVRSLADQIGEGIFPTQRYPGQWSATQRFLFQAVPPTPPPSSAFQLYLPFTTVAGVRGCS